MRIALIIEYNTAMPVKLYGGARLPGIAGWTAGPDRCGLPVDDGMPGDLLQDVFLVTSLSRIPIRRN